MDLELPELPELPPYKEIGVAGVALEVIQIWKLSHLDTGWIQMGVSC